MVLHCQKSNFDINSDITYLNCSAYGPLPNDTVKAGQDAILLKAHPHEIVSEHHFFELPDIARQLTAELLHSNDKDRIALLPSVSYGMSIVAHNLDRLPNIHSKKNIVIIGEEFPNNHYTFSKAAKEHNLELITIDMTDEGTSGEYLLSQITQDTALVVTPHVHWIYGHRYDIEQISRHCQEVGSLFVIDGTQSIGVLDIDVQVVKADAIICAYYKWLLGPYGSAFGYFGPFFDEGIPIEESWTNRIESNNFAGLLRYLEPYRPKAQRYNVGEAAQFIHIPMIIASLKLIMSWGIPNIYQYNTSIIHSTMTQLKSIEVLGGIENIGHLFALKMPQALDLKRIIDLLAKAHIVVSHRGNVLRVSPHIYNDRSDLDKLVNLLNNLTA